jgi:3-oxoacyl-[acyl-carrier-protein] synthase II
MGAGTAPRVAVTGMAATTPAGDTVADLWTALMNAEGTLAARFGTRDAPGHPSDFACRVPDAAANLRGPQGLGKLARRLDPATLLGLGTAIDALVDAGLGTSGQAPGPVETRRCAVVAGTSFGASTTLESPDRGTFYTTMVMHNALPAAISLVAGFQGPSIAASAACATGAVAIGEGARLIRDGIADLVVAGGTELLTAKLLAGYRASGGLSGFHRDPRYASRPFDADRDGIVAAEGAAFVVLERLEHALGRNARIHGQITGYATTCDAHHLTDPSPGGEGAQACMRAALHDARIEAADVVHVNAHATSTRAGDAAEAQAIASVFGPHRVPVTANKGVTGHMIGASGAAEAIVTLLSLAHRVAPATANTSKVDDDLEIDLITARPRELARGPALSNSFGFGGHNACLIISPP